MEIQKQDITNSEKLIYKYSKRAIFVYFFYMFFLSSKGKT